MQTVKPGEQEGGGVRRVQCHKVLLVSFQIQFRCQSSY